MARWPHVDKRPPGRAEDIEGWMEPCELDWLRATVDGLQDEPTVVEIGCFKGRSTYALCERVQAKSPDRRGQMIAVDHWQGSNGEHVFRGIDLHQAKEDFDHNMERFHGQDILTVLKMSSMDAARLVVSDTVNMVFIDGEHSYAAVVDDITAWLYKLRWEDTSVLSGHDYNWESVRRAVDEWGAMNQVRIFAGPGSIWYARPFANQSTLSEPITTQE